MTKGNKDKKDKYYVTTPIYYANGAPHLGGAYTTIAADVLARWHRLKGEKVFFLTGTDEHGKKIQEAAEEKGIDPKEFVDGVVKKWKSAFDLLNISNDNFVRTTDEKHVEEVKKMLQELYDKEFIYKGDYESYYCVGCEQYLTESDLEGGKCPLHDRKPELRKEEAYLFKLSKFQDKLLEMIKSGKYCILPKERRKEIINFIEEGLEDVSISRLKEKVSWGIELPFDEDHCTWVWPDAFWNYLTGLKEEGVFDDFWPPEVQLMAKDIYRVHATIWPALLMALDYELPKTLFIHGYFTVGGRKMSKSLGNVIDPVELANKYGSDSVKYFLMRNIPFGKDGDVSENALVDRHNNELADKLGNLVSRVSSLAEKYGLEEKKSSQIDVLNKVEKVEELMENYEFDKALNEIFSLIDECNEYIQNKKPWKTEDSKVLYEVANAIEAITIMLWPFIPETSEKIAEVFNFDIQWENIRETLEVKKVEKSDVLFEKKEFKEDKGKKENEDKEKNEKGVKNMDKLSFEDWQKLDLRVAKIEEVEDIEKSDKLYKMNVDIGNDKRQLVAGLKNHYSVEELKGKKCIVFTNLEPAELMGVKSNGMVLAAVSEDESKVKLIQPDEDMEVGSKVQ